MKKAFRHLGLLILISMILYGCTRPKADDHETPLPETAENNKVLVVYFSITGNTAKVAEEISALTGGDIYEIVPLDPYEEEDLQYYTECRSSNEQDDPDIRPEIGSPDLDLDSYSTVFIGYPIWYGQEPRIMDTFVEKYDFTGKTVVPFCTSGSSPIGQSGMRLAQLALNGKWLEGARFPADYRKEDIASFVDSVLEN